MVLFYHQLKNNFDIKVTTNASQSQHQCQSRLLFCRYKYSVLKFKNKLLVSVLLCIFIISTYNYFSCNSKVENNSNLNPILTPKILCYILLSQNKLHAANIIQRTWGHKCDRLIFYGNFTNSSENNVNITLIRTKEGYPYLWNKTKAALRHLYKHYHLDYDWFLKADDDTFVIVENLKHFVLKVDSNKPLWSGFKLRSSQMKHGYMSGGAGYVFSKEVLQRVYKLLQAPTSLTTTKNNRTKDKTTCDIHGSIGYEDLELGKCFRDVGVQEIAAVDSKKRHKFLPLPLRTLLNNEISSFHWLRHQAWNKISLGNRCCSPQLISMHKISPEEMLTLYFVLYNTTTTFEYNKQKL